MNQRLLLGLAAALLLAAPAALAQTGGVGIGATAPMPQLPSTS